MDWWAAHGATGLNFHTSGANSTMRYAVFVAKPDSCNLHPLGYALKAFDLDCHGRLVAAKLSPSGRNLRAWAVRGANGALYVTLVNKEYAPGAGGLNVTLEAGGPGRSGQVIFLSASRQGVEATTGITLGGAPINDDGSWTGGWTALAPEPIGGRFVIALPSASVAVVKLSGK